MSDRSNAPHVVIVGGYLTEPVFYRPMRARLLERGAARVSIAGIHLPDWLAMTFAGMGPAMLRSARSIREARQASPAPVVVIGHSAGGIVARLAMSGEAFEGRQANVADDVGCLVTLGTPHRLTPTIPAWRHPGVRATQFLDRVAPGAHLAPYTAYLTVGSTFARAPVRRPSRSPMTIVNRILGRFVGDEPNARGDGIVGNGISQLAGASHVELPDVLHGTFGGPWYGDGKVIDRWWPAAIDAWQSALLARARPVGRSSNQGEGSGRVEPS